MRQYAILLVALVVFIAGLVARRMLNSNESTEALASRAAAVQVVQAAETLAAAIAAGERNVATLQPKLDALTNACRGLPVEPSPAPAANRLCAYNETMLQAATAPKLSDATAQGLQDTIAAVRGGTANK